MNKIRYILTSLLLLAGLAVAAQQEVVIRINRKTNPLPPDVSSYMVKPAQFFNIAVTNPLNEPIDVYFGVRLSQISTIGEDSYAISDIYTPDDVLPSSLNYVMTLLPSTTKVLNPMQIDDMFKWYNSADISGLDGILRDLGSNAIGLLPEGKYRVTLNAFNFSTGALVSNPDLSWCEFDIRYNAEPPQFIQLGQMPITAFTAADHSTHPDWRPDFAGLPLIDLNLNKENNWFKWAKCAMSDITPMPHADYRLEIYRLHGISQQTSLDEIGANNSYRMDYWESEEAGEKYLLALNDFTKYPKNQFFAARVVATPKGKDPATANYMKVKNNGASPWAIIYNTDGTVNDGGDDEGSGSTVIGHDDEETANWRIQLSYPNIKVNNKDNENNGFVPRYLTADKEGNLNIEWDKPKEVKHNENDASNAKLFEKMEFTYDVGIYKIPEGADTDLEEILKTEPLTINKDIKPDKEGKLKTTLKYDDIAKKIEFYTNYIFVVTPKVTKPEMQEGEVIWTGAGNNCYTFAFLLTHARDFKGCNEGAEFSKESGIDLSKGYIWKEIPDEIKSAEDQKVELFVGNVDPEKAFSLRLQPGVKRKKALKEMKDGEASQFSGDCIVQWNPTIGGKKLYVNILCVLKDAEFNSDGQMVAGTCKSKERTDADWIPYNLINFVKMKGEGLFDGVDTGNETARQGAVAKWINDRFDDAGDAIKGGLTKAMTYATSPEGLKKICGSYYDRVVGYGQGASDIYSLLDACFEKDLKSQPITLPMRFPPDLVEKIHTDISLMSMEFTPIGASMDAMMLFNMPGGEKFDYDSALSSAYEPWKQEHQDLFQDEDGNPLEGDKLEEAEKKAQEQHKKEFEENYADIFGGAKGEEKNNINSSGISYSKVLSFVMTDMCVEQGRLWSDTGNAALALDMDIHDTNNNFYFSFKAPKDPNNIKNLDSMDGCSFRWEKMGSEDFSFKLGLAGEFRIPDLLNEEGKENVKVGFGFVTDDWDDFTCELHMDAFRVPDAQDYLFRPGKILWDHSSKSNPAGLKFPKEFAGEKGYDWSKYFVGQGYENITFEEGTADIRWQGLYIEDIGVEFPGAISIDESYDKLTFDEDAYEYDEDGNIKLDEDGNQVYAHKAGDTIKDADGNDLLSDETTTTFTSGEERKFSVGLSNLIFDKTGVTLCGGLKNIFEAKTGKMGGWSLSIDDVHFNVIQNNFRGCGFNGKVKIPLLSDYINYNCDISIQTKSYLDQNVHLYSRKTDTKVYDANQKLCHLVFKTSTPKNANFDFILGKAWIDEKGSWLKVEYLPGHGTDVELIMSGTITLGSENENHTAGKVSKIPFSIPGVRFTGLRIANFSAFADAEMADPNDPKKKTKTDYATKYATEWANEHKDEIASMGGNYLNQLIKDSSLAVSSNADDKEKTEAAKTWGNYIANSMKSREVDLSTPLTNGSKIDAYFSMGDWSFASGEKSFYGFDYNLGGWNFGIETKDKNGNDLEKKNVIVKFGFSGGISLLQKAKTTTTTINSDGTATTQTDVAADQKQQNSQTTTQNADGSTTITKQSGGNELAASVGLTLRAKVKYDFSSISNWKLGFDGVDVDSLKIDGSFGGGMVKVKGVMHFSDTDEKSGFDGSLTLGLMGQEFKVAGGCYDMKKTADELAASAKTDLRKVYSTEEPDKIDHWETRPTYKAIYFLASYDGKDSGIPIAAGVSLNALMGGFYYNYTVPDVDTDDYDKFVEKLTGTPTPKFGAYGFAAGLGLKWGEAAAAITGKFSLLVGYNATEGRLGTFKMLGDVRGLKDALKAKACISYTQKGMENPTDPDREQHFNVSVTVDVTADMTDQLADFVGGKENLEKIKKTFTEDHKSGLGDLTNGEQDTKKEKDADADESGNKNEASEAEANEKGQKAAQESGAGFQASMGAHISLLVDIKSRPNDPDPEVKGTKWMVCIGEPELAKRCSVTLIDVAVGKGDWRIWAKVYANAYLCFGNKLPGNGDLPELPAALKSFLDDGKVGGGGDTGLSKEGGKMAKLDAQRQEAVDAMISGGASKGKANNGGVMFGMQAGADFGCRFGIGYVELGGLVGFDMVMKLMKDNCLCLDEKGRLKPMGGKGGAYAEGQVYAYAYGRAGLILNLGFWSGDVDLLDMSVGAVLKGGFPNPTWAYGKLKAKGSLFGGLIKFNKKIEMKMGQVCMPLTGNPLDNIDIISEASFGYDNENDGYDPENAVDCGAPLTFVTNMGIGEVLEILDEDLYQTKMGVSNDKNKSAIASKAATRAFKFYVRSYAQSSSGQQWAVRQTTDNTSFEVQTGVFQEKNQYKVELHGWCKELFIKDDTFVEEDPFIRDMDLGKTVQRPWGQDFLIYFNTAPYSDDMSKVARLVGPYDATSTEYDIKHPFVSLMYPLPQFGTDGVEVFGDLEEEITAPNGDKHLILPDQLYSDDGQYRRLTSTQSKYQGIRMRQYIEEGIDRDGNPYKYITVLPMNQSDIDGLKIEPGRTYRWTFYEMNMAGLNKLRGGVESTYEKLSSGDTAALLDLQNNEEVQQWLKESGNENMVAEMLRDYQDASNDFNTNEMEARVNSISAEAYSRGSSFRTEILSFETRCAPPLVASGYGGYAGYAPTFREQMENNMRTTANYERLLYSRKNPDSSPTRLTGGGIYFKPIALKIGDNPDQLDIYRNPYHRLWWWNWKAMYARSNKVGNAMTPRLMGAGIDVYFKGYDYYENGETMRMSMKGGHRLKQSATNESSFMFTSREDAKVTFRQFAEWFNVFGSNRWCTPVNKDFKEYLKTVKKAYNADCSVAYNLDRDIHEVYATLVGSQEYKSGQNEVDYGKAKVDGAKRFEVYSDYLMLAQMKKAEEDAIAGNENNYFGTTLNRMVYSYGQNESWVSYPAWQVGAMYMNSRYYLTPNRMSQSGFSVSKYENTTNHMKQFLRPWDFINNTYTYYDQATSDELCDNLSGARGFEGGAPVTLEFLLMRPNRYNVLGQTNNDGETLDVSTWMPSDYQVSRGEQADRIVYMRTDLEGNNATVSSVFENIGAGSVLFSDTTVEYIVKHYLGKDVVTYDDLKDVKEFTYPKGYNDIKTFDDFYNFPNLEKFNWKAAKSIDNLNFEGNPKLRELVIEDCKYYVDVDFSSCPNLERLVIKCMDTEPWYKEKNNIKLLKLFPTIHLKRKPDFTKLPLLKRVQINYADLDEIDLSNCAYLEYINFEYTNVGAKYICIPDNPTNLNQTGYTKNTELYVFDLTKQKNSTVKLGHQLAMWNGYLARPTYWYLNNIDGVDSSMNWGWVSWDYDGRNVFVRVTDPTLYSSFVSGGRNAEPSVRVITPDGTTSVSQVKEDLSDLDENLRKLLFAEYGKAKTDNNGKPLTSKHQPNEIEYWTDLYTINTNDLNNVYELDASGCNIESLDHLQFYMPNLHKLDASGNILTAVDLSAFKELTEVDLSGNRLNKFEIGSSNSGIAKLDFSGNRVRIFDFAKLPNLTELNCSNNSLYQVDLSNASKLTRLDCSHNNLGDIDIRTCPALKWLDCSYNQMRSAPNQFGATIIFDETVNTVLNTLIASHINSEDWSMCQVQKLTGLDEINLSGNSGLQSVTVSKSIKKINVADTGVDVMYYGTPNGTDRVLSETRYISLKNFDAHNSNFGRSYPGRTVSIKNLDRLDISECDIDVINVTGSPEIYVGQTARTGKRIAVAYSNDAGLARWDLEFKSHPKNANTYAFRGSINSSDVQTALASDIVDENMVRLRKALGDELYNHIKGDSTLAAIPEGVLSSTRVIDARPYGRTMTDLKFVVNEFPKLEELYLSQQRIDDNAYAFTRGFNKIVIENPYSQLSPETTLKLQSRPKVVEGSLCKISNYNLKSLNWDILMLYFETADFSGCQFGSADKLDAPIGGGVNKRFIADGSNLKKAHLVAGDNLKYLSLKDCVDMDTLRVNSLGRLQPDSLILDGCNPEMTMVFTNAVEAKRWVNNFAERYPDVKIALQATAKDGKEIIFSLPDLPEVTPEYLAEAIDAVYPIAKNISSENFNKRPLTEKDKESARKMFPTSKTYLRVWKEHGHYPDGLRWGEFRRTYLDVTGAGYTDGNVLNDCDVHPVKLIAMDKAFNCDTFYGTKDVESIELYNNPALKNVVFPATWHGEYVGLSRTSCGSDAINRAIAQADTVMANNLYEGVVLNVVVPEDANCKLLRLKTDNIESITLNKTLDQFSAVNPMGDQMVIYVNAELPSVTKNFALTNSSKVIIRSKRDDVIKRWFNTYKAEYPDVRFEMGFSGCDTYVPISSYSDANITSAKYGALYRSFPDGWADLEVIDLRGKQVGEKALNQLLQETPKATMLITGDGLTTTRPVIAIPDNSPIRVLDFRGFPKMETIYIVGEFVDDGEIILDGNTKLAHTNNIFNKAERVSASGCSNVVGTITVNADDKAHNLDLSGTGVTEILLYRPITALKATKMLGDTLGIRFTGSLDDVTLALDKARLRSVVLDRDGIAGWFGKFAAIYPSAKVYVNYNGTNHLVTSLDDYKEKIGGVVGKFLKVLHKNMPEVDESNLADVKTLDIRGAGADDEFFKFMATYMPNVESIVADAPGSLVINEDGGVRIPVMPTPLREMRAAGNAGVYSISFGDWGGDFNSDENAVGDFSAADFESFPYTLGYVFRKLVMRDCSKLESVSIQWDYKVSDIDLSGSALNGIEIGKEMDRMTLRNMPSPHTRVYTEWLPADPKNFDLTGTNGVIEFYYPDMIERWFAEFAPLYPGIKVICDINGEETEISSAEEYALMPLLERNPGVTLDNLASQKKISLDNCPEVYEMLEVIYEKCPKLEEITLMRNYSWMPDFTYSREGLKVDFGTLETPKTLIVDAPLQGRKIAAGTGGNLTVRFTSAEYADDWKKQKLDFFLKYAKYVVNVCGKELITDNFSLAHSLIKDANASTLDITDLSLTPEEITAVLEIMPNVTSLIAKKRSVDGSELTLPAISHPYMTVDLSDTPELTKVYMEGVADGSQSTLDLTNTKVDNIGPLAKAFHTVKTDLGKTINAVTITNGEVKFDNKTQLKKWFDKVSDLNGVTTYYKINGQYMEVTSYNNATMLESQFSKSTSPFSGVSKSSGIFFKN